VTAEAFAQRVGARRGPRGWIARCPAHDDRGPSLSIATGADGRVLLKCFAGCDAERIAAALGLRLSDLFEQDRRAKSSPQRARREPTPTEIKAELLREAWAFRERHGIAPTDNLLCAEKNQIRHIVSVRLGITLEPLVRPLWEGSYGGRERDPLWAAAFCRAWADLWFERGWPKPPYELADRAQQRRQLRPAIRIRIEERAAQIMSALAAAERAIDRSA
jgi:hypothetical protein